MLAKERILYILKRLQNQSTVRAVDLSKELGVSKSTILRDLAILEAEGKISRERGGAANNKIDEIISELTEAPILEKINVNTDSKKGICETAAEIVRDGDLVFIDSGTTSAHLIPFIKHKKIKIITNSLHAMNKLTGCTASVILLGGTYHPKHEAFYGISTLEQAKQFRFDHSFTGASGIDLKFGEAYASESDMCALKKTVIERSQHAHLLLDDSKLTTIGVCKICNLENFENVFVNDFPRKKEKPANFIVCK